MKASLILGLALLLQDAPATLTFLPPKDSKPADVERAAKVIEKRCLEFGYKGVRAKVVDGSVMVSCETGITAAMEPWIVHYSTVPALKVEIGFERKLKEREADQYPPGEAAPNGARWASVLKQPDAARPRAARKTWVDPYDFRLILDLPRINVKSHLRWVKPTDEKPSYFELSGPPVKVYRELPAATIEATQFILDGRPDMFPGSELRNPDEKRIQFFWRNEGDAYFGICINNPLPFPLDLKK